MKFKMREAGVINAHKLIERARSAMMQHVEQDDLWSFYLLVRRMAHQIYPIDAISISVHLPEASSYADVFLSEKGPFRTWETGQTLQGLQHDLSDDPISSVIRARSAVVDVPVAERTSRTFCFDKRCTATLYVPSCSPISGEVLAVIGLFSDSQDEFDCFWVALYEMLASWVGICLSHRVAKNIAIAVESPVLPSPTDVSSITTLGLSKLEMEILVWRGNGATQELLMKQMGLYKKKFYGFHASAFQKIGLTTRTPDVFVRNRLVELNLPCTIEEVRMHFEATEVTLELAGSTEE